MNIKKVKHGDDITELHMLWVEFVEEIGEYLVLNSIAENYRSILEDQAYKWVKEDKMVVFGCFNPTLEGFVAAKENTGNSLFTASTVVYINAIYLEPEYRGKGYGARLISRVEEWAEEDIGADHISLSVEPNNEPAQKFWESMGYQTTLEKRTKSTE